MPRVGIAAKMRMNAVAVNFSDSHKADIMPHLWYPFNSIDNFLGPQPASGATL